MTVATTDTVAAELVRGRGGGGPASTRTVVAYGFWIFIISDITMFSALFAAYAVLSGRTAGGPTASEVINLRHVFIETMCLLLSSYACGLGALSAERQRQDRFLIFSVFRGRDGHCWPPPAQIRTRPTKASGSYLGCLTSKRTSGQG